MVPSVGPDWLSMLLITGAVVPALGATVFGYFVLRRRGLWPAQLRERPVTFSSQVGEAS